VRKDAKEYDPKLKATFEVARKEAKEALEKRGASEAFDSTVLLNSETQRILAQKHHIDWMTPEELNSLIGP
jgi:hypothetical protein